MYSLEDVILASEKNFDTIVIFLFVLKISSQIVKIIYLKRGFANEMEEEKG